MKDYKMILFDLDGTLLPMELETFMGGYLKSIATKMATYGYEPKTLGAALWDSIAKMMANDGAKTNEEVFWDRFCEIYGKDAIKDKKTIDDFYRNEFQNVKNYCGFNPKASETVYKLKAAGFRVALATNPFFPQYATFSRIRWAGLEPSDFELITTYENSHTCKPNLSYYKEVLSTLNIMPSETLMVGNDALEDMIAKELGIDVFLLTDCLINTKNRDISQYPQGSFDELLTYIGL